MPTRIVVGVDAAAGTAPAVDVDNGGAGGRKRRRRGGEKSRAAKNNSSAAANGQNQNNSSNDSTRNRKPPGETLEHKVARSIGGRSGYGALESTSRGGRRGGGGGGSRTSGWNSSRRGAAAAAADSRSTRQEDEAAAAAAVLANRRREFKTPGTAQGQRQHQRQQQQTRNNPYTASAASTVTGRRRRSSVGIGGSVAPSLGLTPAGRTQHTNAISHTVCAISENLARETCVASFDAGAPVALQVTKQANGQTYAETLAYLEILQPDEILLNEGRRNSQLAQKVMALYNAEEDLEDKQNPLVMEKERRSKVQMNGQNVAKSRRNFAASSRRRHDHPDDDDDTLGLGDGDASTMHSAAAACLNDTVVKFVPRSYFDQTRGADLLRRVAREGTYDATVVEEYILLSAAYAVMQYSQHCLGASFCRNTVDLVVNSGGSNRMTIDRATLLNLELLSNARTGKAANSLIGTIDCTKTTVGARLLRTNIMAPPTRVDTINARLNLVDTFLEDEEFFYVTMEHLQALPDIDRMLTHMTLQPKVGANAGRGGNGGLFGNGEQRQVNARMASRGIAALVCIKSTLGVIPTFAKGLDNQLKELDRRDRRKAKGDEAEDDESDCDDGEDESSDGMDSRTVVTDRSSLLIGLGGDPGRPNVPLHGPSTRHQLLRAILTTMKQPALKEILDAVLDIFTESTTYSRNSHVMRHQECFALKPNTDGMMDVLRKAFLANVDDIYRLADEYAETYAMTVAVKETTGRGYFLSVPADMADDLPTIFIQCVKSGRFIHCTTEDVLSLNARSQENVQDLLLMTHERIQQVLCVARARYDALASLSDAIALLDVCHCFADNAASSRLPWTRPQVSDNGLSGNSANMVASSANQNTANTAGRSGAIAIRNGRFAIDVSGAGVMLHDGPAGSDFIPNDTYALAETMTVITGCNGSGKSTYLKQIAIIVVLAHCGCYVPAEEACIPIRDRLCTRIGTADDQEHNISTFMLEMKETAFILNNATNKSLILIDELGRATSNEDGVAIAWAVSEFLLKKRAMTFFVTHYPQLSKLADVYSNVQNQHLSASMTSGGNGDINYFHKIKPGPCKMTADYGVEMAGTCGWPTDVVADSRKIREEVEEKLPDGAVCEEQVSRKEEQCLRRKAEEILADLAKRLAALKESGGRLSADAQRSYLQDLLIRSISSQDKEIAAMIKEMISEQKEERVLAPIPLGRAKAESAVRIRTLGNGKATVAGPATRGEEDGDSFSAFEGGGPETKRDKENGDASFAFEERQLSKSRVSRALSASTRATSAETSTKVIAMEGDEDLEFLNEQDRESASDRTLIPGASRLVDRTPPEMGKKTKSGGIASSSGGVSRSSHSRSLESPKPMNAEVGNKTRPQIPAQRKMGLKIMDSSFSSSSSSSSSSTSSSSEDDDSISSSSSSSDDSSSSSSSSDTE